MSSKTRSFEAIVLGGGPAGAAAAILLARRSHQVALVRPQTPPAGQLAESLPPSSRRILEELGIAGAIEQARFHPNLGNTVWWAGQDRRTERFADGARGVHVDRASLERTLVAAAESVGVHVLLGMSARRAEQHSDAWTVTCQTGDGGTLTLTAPWLVDATGRHGLVAREAREPDRSTTTLAVVRRYRRPGGWAEDVAGHTLIESHPDGWAWSVPLAPDARCVTAMLDQRRTEVAGVDLGALLEAELAKTGHMGELLEGADPDGEAWACPASLYTSSYFGRDGVLFAGDAGSCIDPLSSFGVKKALASGWLAGVAVHTALVEPAIASEAISFFDNREREVYRSYRRRSATFFAEAAAHFGTEYWTTRSQAAEDAGGHREVSGTVGHDEEPTTLGETRPAEAAVRAAFNDLRSREGFDVEADPTLRSIERAAIQGHRIARMTHLATDTVTEGVRFLHNIDLVVLLDEAPRHTDVAALWEAYNGHAPPVPLPDFLTGLSSALAIGILRHRDA